MKQMGTIRTRNTRKKSGPRRGETRLLRQTRSAAPLQAPAPRQRTGEDRVREAGGPQDLALYRCSCGKTFAGDVSTSVACPSCGTAQAW